MLCPPALGIPVTATATTADRLTPFLALWYTCAEIADDLEALIATKEGFEDEVDRIKCDPLCSPVPLVL